MSDSGTWVIAADASEGIGVRLRELWRYRRVLIFFSIKAVQSLYAKTRLGVAWIFIRTLFPLIASSFVFGSVMDVPSGTVPYFIFFATGTLAWNLFDGPLLRASRGIDVNRELLRKLYIPRVILPIGQMSAGLVKPAIVALVLAGSAIYYRAVDGVWHLQLTWDTLRTLAAAVTILVLATGLSLWTSVWLARARDVRFVLRHVLGFWMIVTPVIYPLSLVPAGIRWLAYLNPLTAPVEMFKSGLLAGTDYSWPWMGYAAVVTLAVLCGGAWHFARTEHHTMDTL